MRVVYPLLVYYILHLFGNWFGHFHHHGHHIALDFSPPLILSCNSFHAGEFSNVNLNFHHLILLRAPLYRHGTWWGRQQRSFKVMHKRSRSIWLEHVCDVVWIKKKSWRDIRIFDLLFVGIQTTFRLMMSVQKSWLADSIWLNNNNIPVSTRTKVVEKIPFLSWFFRCVQTRRSVIFHLQLSVVF